jgi:hypothetical protein
MQKVEIERIASVNRDPESDSVLRVPLESRFGLDALFHNIDPLKTEKHPRPFKIRP